MPGTHSFSLPLSFSPFLLSVGPSIHPPTLPHTLLLTQPLLSTYCKSGLGLDKHRRMNIVLAFEVLLIPLIGEDK